MKSALHDPTRVQAKEDPEPNQADGDSGDGAGGDKKP